MMRQAFFRSSKPILRNTTSLFQRSFAVSANRMGEGDTGGVRSGGSASSDAFNKREQASENFEIKRRENEKLAALKAKIEAQQKHLKDLGDSIDEFQKEQGGEKN